MSHLRQRLGLVLLSGSGLFLEITLTRLLSSLYFAPYVFAVISLAILGIGLGAALASWRTNLQNYTYLPTYVLLVGLSTLVIVSFTTLTASLNLQILLFSLLALPYVFIGIIFVTIFGQAPNTSPQLYMADLIGAGLGALVAIPALNTLGAINCGLLVAIALGICAIIFQPSTIWNSVAFVIIGLVIFGSNLSFNWLEPDLSSIHTDKPIKTSLADDGKILETRWDAFARTDLVQPGNGEPYRIYVDGGAGSIMPPETDNDFLINDIGFFPFATDQPTNVMVIGPGGGLDVWFALQVGSEVIVAVEVNQASVDLVNDYANYNGDLYAHPSVRMVVDEGRSTLRREGAKYDLIFLSQVITSVTERSGYGLTENTLYTVEAFEEYLDHLQPDGQIALKLYDEATLTRALSVALAAFNKKGLSDSEALRHIVVLLDPRSEPPIPLLLVRDRPLSYDDALAHGAVAREVGFVPLYLPGVLAGSPLDKLEAGDVDYATIIEESEFDISPPNDNRPFFFQFERGLPKDLERLWVILGVVSLLGGSLLIYVQRRVDSVMMRWSPLYFAGLGIGFIAIEIVMIQKTRLILGHPTLAITAVLATVLMGGGIGSWLISDWSAVNSQKIPWWPTINVIILALLWFGGWPVLSENLPQATLIVRLFATIVSILPVAAVMGMPFPLGLQAIGSDNRQLAISWAVNGVSTVIGSVGAITVAILRGFDSAFLVGIAAYILSFGVALLIQFREK